MAINWTKEQSEAISHTGEALLLSAAAGSGKTTVLIERLRRLLADPESGVTSDNIIVVTFTREAAAQMKHRLQTQLSESLSDPDITPEIAQHISAQLSLISAANISTIHSFCFRLIREYAGVLGIDPGFGIAEQQQEDTIVKAALDSVFDEMCANENDKDKITRLSEMFAPDNKNSNALKEIILEIRRKLLALPFPDIFGENVTERYLNGILKDTGFLREYAEMILNDLRRAYGYADAAVRFIEENCDMEDKSKAKLRMNFIHDRDEIGSIIKIYEKKSEDPVSVLDPAEIDLESFNVSSFTLDNGMNSTDILKKNLKDKYREICEKYLRFSAASKNKKDTPTELFTLEQIKSDYRIHAEVSELIFDIIERLRKAESDLKAEHNVLGFSDAEQYACALLCRHDGEIMPTELALELQKRYSLIMVDEFQDSTKIQELIFRMLSLGGTASSAGSNFFAVGDIKQSIYRFRAAEPGLFSNNLKNDALKKVLLNTNYRSSKQIVDFVNNAFNAVMSQKCGGIDYGENDSLIFGNTNTAMDKTEVIVIDEEAAGASDTDSYKQAECTAVANRIYQLIEGGTPPEDICILTRRNSTIKDFGKALGRLGISYEGSTSDSILETGEVKTILNFLRILNNPSLNIPMGAVLMSPLFGFTADDMAMLRLADRTQDIYKCVKLCAEREDSLGEMCRRFGEIFNALRSFSITHTPEEIIYEIYRRTYAISVYSVFPDGSQRGLNLYKFAQLAEQYSNSVNGIGRNLGGFIRRMNTLDENKSSIEAPDNTSGKAVKIMTFHKSKGLEFPYVFICDNSRKFKKGTSSIVFDSTYGIAFDITEAVGADGMKKNYTSMPAKVLRERYNNSLRDEEMMLLYVGLTRAKNKLVITRYEGGTYTKKQLANSALVCEGKNDLSIMNGSCFAEWIDTILHFEDGLTEYIHFNEDKDAQNIVKEPLLLADEAAMLRDTLEKYKELNIRSSGIAAKFTVSKLTHKNNESEEEPEEQRTVSRPRLGQLTGTSRGTAYHTFMELCSFSELHKRPDIDLINSEKKRLLAKMSEEEIRCIDPKHILKFAVSSLFARMTGEIFKERQFLARTSDIISSPEEYDLFGISSGDTMIQGIADLIFYDDTLDGYVLVDYKTDRYVSPDELSKLYSKQLQLYARAFDRILDKPVRECYIFSFEHGEIPIAI